MILNEIIENNMKAHSANLGDINTTRILNSQSKLSQLSQYGIYENGNLSAEDGKHYVVYCARYFA
jgi:hypothetical protein